jgi:hypothetical protein
MQTPPAAQQARDASLKWLTLASVVPVAMMLVASILKPEWRDEFWALYITEPYADPAFSISKLHLDYGHPPFYYTLLHAWRLIDGSDFWARLSSPLIVFLGAIAAWRLARGRAELPWFLLICAGCYWVIYPATETRSYVLVFVLSAISVLITARALDEPDKRVGWLAAWCAVGMALSLTLHFGALWMAALGLSLGIAELRRGRTMQFVGWGVASTLAILPDVLWILSGSVMKVAPGVFSEEVLADNQLLAALEQILRGLVVKLVGSNIAIAGAAIVGAAVLWRKRETIDRVLLTAIGLVVAIALAIHLLWVPLVKERSFIVIMPALVFLAARAIVALPLESLAGRRFLMAAPVIAAITPFAFIPEYFKDREELGRTIAFLKEKGANCTGAQIMAYYRSGGIRPIAAWTTKRTFAAALPDAKLELADAESRRVDPARTCAVRAVAFLLVRREGPVAEEAKAALRKSGVPVDELVEHSFAKGRQRVYVAP